MWCVCVYVCVHARVPQAGRAGEGEGQAVPQGEDRRGPDSSQRGDAHGRAGRRLPSRAHSITAFTNNNKNNSNNTHRHQSGHSHSALDSKAPTARGGEGQGR